MLRPQQIREGPTGQHAMGSLAPAVPAHSSCMSNPAEAPDPVPDLLAHNDMQLVLHFGVHTGSDGGGQLVCAALEGADQLPELAQHGVSGLLLSRLLVLHVSLKLLDICNSQTVPQSAANHHAIPQQSPATGGGYQTLCVIRAYTTAHRWQRGSIPIRPQDRHRGHFLGWSQERGGLQRSKGLFRDGF